MFSKKSLPIILLLVLGGGIFYAVQSSGYINNPRTKYEKILRSVGEMLEEGHYSPKKIDDDFSKTIFKKFLQQLDGDKTYFLQSDIDALKKYETKIDDEIHGQELQSFYAINDIYNKRVDQAEVIYKDILSKPFDFTKDENVSLDGEKSSFPKNDAELKESWRKRLKYMTLDRYVDLLEQQEKNKGKEGFIAKSNADLEKEARDKVAKVMEKTFTRIRNQFTEEERFNAMVNEIATTMDPHTTFFPPKEKRAFDESMSGRFYGIGASLKDDDGQIKIATIVTGAPAWKSGEIQVGDAITKVGQGNEERQDLNGYAVEDAVKLIRGKKGTEVKLFIKKSDGVSKVVSLVRDEIVLEETFARSAIVNSGGKKIGYIYLPEFYADWERPNGARCSQDVAKEVIKLKQQNVDGITIDLRNNGGGSLFDVIQMAGLFIKDGPIVQVKGRDEKAQVLPDRDKSVLYDGPLTVMVNEFSASASEIFAAAMQDYGRAVIIGSSSTYGKGTVQRNISLNGDKLGELLASNSNDLGALKLTLQKFYRVNGGSTQLKGVASDIVLPDQYEYLKLREKDDADALPWDEIQKADYAGLNEYNINSLKTSSEQRVNSNPGFKLLREDAQWLSKENDKVYSLQIDKFRAEKKQLADTYKQMENILKQPNNLDISFLPGEENRFKDDQAKAERSKQWLKNLTTDIHLGEAINVMKDMIGQGGLAKIEGSEPK
ncbi:MAG: carboxy terminal-processing peptidase [Sphingobacteriales bacterium]|nr:carboxy terminal-processing peptidase [Sphingobacteriales bacterium]